MPGLKKNGMFGKVKLTHSTDHKRKKLLICKISIKRESVYIIVVFFPGTFFCSLEDMKCVQIKTQTVPTQVILRWSYEPGHKIMRDEFPVNTRSLSRHIRDMLIHFDCRGYGYDYSSHIVDLMKFTIMVREKKWREKMQHNCSPCLWG